MGLNGDKRYPYTMLPYMQLTQSNKYRGFRMIEELAILIRASGIQAYVDVVDDRGRITGGGRRNYETARITVRSHRNVTALLRNLIPHMITRKQTAQDLLRFLMLFPPRTGPDAGPSALRGKYIGVREAREKARLAQHPIKSSLKHPRILPDEIVAKIRARFPGFEYLQK